MGFSVTKNGVELNKDLYTIDDKNRIFSSQENGLVLDFSSTSNYTFKVLHNCDFKTKHNCTFETGANCTFETKEDCVVIRRDIFEVIKLKKDQKIKLNEIFVRGYKIIKNTKIIIIDGKEIEISLESYNNFKKQFKQGE